MNNELGDIGELLRKAREGAGMTQASVATKLGVARTTLVAIEQGSRRARVEELQTLASLYGTSLNALLRQESVTVDLRPRFRRAGEDDKDVERAAAVLTRLVQAEVELENLLGIRRARHDPPERPILPGNVLVQAEQDAAELRQWLGLALAPIHDIISLLELQIGARVFVRPLPHAIAGLYAFDDSVGACILLNAHHPRARRTQTGGHELGHLVSTRRSPDALYDGCLESTREERYANAFGRYFLAPARAVLAKFQEITAGSTKLTRRHVILLAHYFGISREAAVRRLEELRLTKPGTWEWFADNGGITDEQAKEVLGSAAVNDPERADAHRPMSIRLSGLASEAWRRNLLSEGQLARLLDIDRVEAREIIDEFEAEGVITEKSPWLLG
jgi:Zn-dependent peptidase ImmA (M78 family)/DNA-binding XRE family transcriptional regulator